MTDDDQVKDRDAEEGTRPVPSPTPPPPDVSLFDEVTSTPLEPIDFPGTDKPLSVVSSRASRPNIDPEEPERLSEPDALEAALTGDDEEESEPVSDRSGPREAVLFPDAQAVRKARARITLKIPDDDIPQSSPQPPAVEVEADTKVLSPATVVQAMRIIAIGESAAPPPEARSARDDVPEHDPEGIPSSDEIEPLNVNDVEATWTPQTGQAGRKQTPSQVDAEELRPEDLENGQHAAPHDSDAEELEPENDEASEPLTPLPPPVAASERSPEPPGTTPLPPIAMPLSPSASAPPPPMKPGSAVGMPDLKPPGTGVAPTAPNDEPSAIELSDDEVAPASTDQGAGAITQDASPVLPVAESPVAPRDVEIRSKDEAPSPPPAATKPEATPAPDVPPPPPPPPARPAAAVEAAKPAPSRDDMARRRRRVRPGWEEVFSDDFVRAYARLTPKEVAAEVTFIEESLGVQRGGVMLDLGCGMGQHAVDLAARGYNVVGYDLSLTMLALAADEAQERGQKINFLQGDMREMAFEEMFDGVFSWATSFGFFDEEKNLSVLKRVHRALRKGGLFLLDLVNRDYICPRLPSLAWFEGDGCVCIDDSQFDAITSRVRVKRTIMLEDGSAREVEYSVRLYSLHEIGKMLHEVGFKVIEVSGHPATAGAFFDAESPRVITLAERR